MALTFSNDGLKILNGLSPDIMNDVLPVSKHRYNTPPYNLFVTDRPRTDRYGRNSIPYRTNQIWNLLPPEIKNSGNLDSFKFKIKQWRCLECPCTFCKTFTESRIFISLNFIS